MTINYRVEVKHGPHSPWRDTGIIESNRELAEKIWTDIAQKYRFHAFRLITITYGIAIER